MQNPPKNQVGGGGNRFRRVSFFVSWRAGENGGGKRSGSFVVSTASDLLLYDVVCFFSSLSLFLYIERPPSQTTPTANLQSCKMDSRKIRLEGQLKTPTSPELAVPVRRVPATIFAPQISRMADMNSRANMERTHGGLQPAPLGA